MDHADYGLVDDPLAEDLGEEPTLELASVPPADRHSKPKQVEGGGDASEKQAASPKPTKAERRRKRIFEIAGYGPQPTSFLQVVPYFVRVFMRRRVVADELADLSVRRKQAEAMLDDALCEVAQALYLRRADPALAPLARHCTIVVQAESQIDAGHMRTEEARRDATETMQSIHQRLEAAEVAAEPFRARHKQLSRQLDKLRARADTAQASVRSCEQKIRKLEGKKVPEPQDVDALQALHQERAQAHGELQSAQLLMHPLEEEMTKVQGRLAQCEAAAADVQTEQARHSQIAERDQARHARQAGDARYALQSALKSLAQTAIDQGLTHAVEREVADVEKLKEDTQRKRKREGLHRDALSSYDEGSYRNGLFALVGGTSTVFLTVMVLILR